MPITDEERAELFAQFQAQQAASQPPVTEAPKPTRESVVGVPDVAFDAGPEYYVHLANGQVVESHDSVSTHMDVDGSPVLVIGRFQKGA